MSGYEDLGLGDTLEPKQEGKNYAVGLGNGVNLVMIWIPGGSFKMGTSLTPQQMVERFGGYENWYEDEIPVHLVELDGFWIGKCELMNVQYNQFRPWHDSGEYEGRSLNGRQQPVTRVSWHDAKAFCDWLSEATGDDYALPMEAQWEYACRAGASTHYFWGDEWDKAYGNADADDRFEVTAPVVRPFKPNAFGLYDMAGNISEWCADWYDKDYYSSASATERNPKAPEPTPEERKPSLYNQGGRVMRGGSYYYGPEVCRSADRSWNYENALVGCFGFRVVCNPRKNDH
jgi:formylglycine-generating enzyme required for sulfatase activity